MKRFYLQRTHDVSGVSGIGNIAEGVQFDDGQAVIIWLSGEDSSINIYKSVEKLISTHGHHGATQIVWIDSASSNVIVEKNGCKCELESSGFLSAGDKEDILWLRAPLTKDEQKVVDSSDIEELVDWMDI